MTRQDNSTMIEEEALQTLKREFLANDPSVTTHLLLCFGEVKYLVEECGFSLPEARGRLLNWLHGRKELLPSNYDFGMHGGEESEKITPVDAIRYIFPEIGENAINALLPFMVAQWGENEKKYPPKPWLAFRCRKKEPQIKADQRVTFLVSHSLLNIKRNCSRSRRSTVRSAAKADDDGGGDGDSDGPGEPPGPRLVLPSHNSPTFSTPKPINPTFSRTTHPCRWSLCWRWAA